MLDLGLDVLFKSKNMARLLGGLGRLKNLKRMAVSSLNNEGRRSL